MSAVDDLVVLDRDLWIRHRPGWTTVGWFDAPMRPQVRDLTVLPLGPDLVTKLVAVGMPTRCPAEVAGGHYTGDGQPAAAVLHPDWVARDSAHRIGVTGRPCACMEVVAAAWHAVTSWAEAQTTTALVAAVGYRDQQIPMVNPDDPHWMSRLDTSSTLRDPAVDGLAPALRLAPGSAQLRVTNARNLHTHPQLQTAVVDGRVGFFIAIRLLHQLHHLPTQVIDAIVDTVLIRIDDRRRRGLRDWTATDIFAAARRVAMALRVDWKPDRDTASRGRRVIVVPRSNHLATLMADLPRDVAERILARLVALDPGRSPDDDRTADQRRADIFTDLLLDSDPSTGPSTGSGTGAEHTGDRDNGGPSTGSGTGAEHTGDRDNGGPSTGSGTGAGGAAGETGTGGRGRRHVCAEVDVVIDFATLVGLGDRPGELVGIGPIPADIARELAADRKWRLWITTAQGVVTTITPTTYTPTTALARLIRARDPYCRYPGCRRQSRHCDLDHVIPFPAGLTDHQNVGPLCRRHHRMKTGTLTTLTTHDDGHTTTFTTSTGTTITDTTPPRIDP